MKIVFISFILFYSAIFDMKLFKKYFVFPESLLFKVKMLQKMTTQTKKEEL